MFGINYEKKPTLININRMKNIPVKICFKSETNKIHSKVENKEKPIYDDLIDVKFEHIENEKCYDTNKFIYVTKDIMVEGGDGGGDGEGNGEELIHIDKNIISFSLQVKNILDKQNHIYVRNLISQPDDIYILRRENNNYYIKKFYGKNPVFLYEGFLFCSEKSNLYLNILCLYKGQEKNIYDGDYVGISLYELNIKYPNLGNISINKYHPSNVILIIIDNDIDPEIEAEYRNLVDRLKVWGILKNQVETLLNSYILNYKEFNVLCFYNTQENILYIKFVEKFERIILKRNSFFIQKEH